MNALRHASNNFNSVKGSIERLSSGLRVNRASDNPASLIASERLRGQIVGTKQALSNAETSVSMLQTAEGALNEVSAILINLRQLSVHAANEAVNDRLMLEADQNEIENLLASLDRIASNTTFGGKTLLDGSNGANGVAVGKGLRFVEAKPETEPSPENGYTVDITQVATRAKATGEIPLTVENIGDGLTLVISEGGKNAVLNTQNNEELKTAIAKIKKNYREAPEIFTFENTSRDIRSVLVTQMEKKLHEAGLNVDFFTDQDGRFVVRHKEFGSETSLSVTSSIPGVLSKQADIAEFAHPGKDVEGTIGGQVALGKGQYLTAVEGTKPQGLTVQYDRELGLKEIPIYDEGGNKVGSEMVEETNEDIVGSPSDKKEEGFVHVSQRSISFQVGPSERQSAKLSISNIRSNQLARGIVNESGFTSLADIDVTSLQGARDTIRLVDEAVEEISLYRGDLGSFQKNALESNLNALKIATENLTQAESTIRDADMASEMSDLTSGQILLSSSTAMLAQANQVPQAVLGLISGGGK